MSDDADIEPHPHLTVRHPKLPRSNMSNNSLAVRGCFLQAPALAHNSGTNMRHSTCGADDCVLLCLQPSDLLDYCTTK